MSASRPCTCERPTCYLCRLFRTNDRYRRLWGGDVPRCAYLGEDTGERQDCLPCAKKSGARIRLKVFACTHPGHAANPTTTVAACQRCSDYSRHNPHAGRELTRNLLYHLWPVRGDAWRWNVQQLLRRIRLFNGRRIVAVVTDDGTEPFEVVRDAFRGEVLDFIQLPNDPSLREVKSFVPLFERVQTLDPWEVTFYAHAKGVRHAPGQQDVVRRWAEVMYEVCLDYWPAVERLLTAHPAVGPFKTRNAEEAFWHYSGTFFWLRNRDVFSRSWWQIERRWIGMETWINGVFKWEEAGGILSKHQGPWRDMYGAGYWQSVIEPELQRWKAENAGSCRPVGS